MGRYSLSDDVEGARQRAARQSGSEGQVELVPGQESTGGQQEQERTGAVDQSKSRRARQPRVRQQVDIV